MKNLKKPIRFFLNKIYGSPKERMRKAKERMRKAKERMRKAKERMRKARNQACRRYLGKISNTKYANYFTHDMITQHVQLMSDKYKNKQISEMSITLVKTRFCRTVEFIEKSAKEDIRKENTTALDVGDASSVFLKYFNKKGISLNIDAKAVNFLRSIGIQALQGDIHNIPLPDNAVDYSFAFEIIEHVEGPIFALRELGGVTKKSVFVTIPYMEKTRIRDFGYWNRQEKNYQILEKVRYHYHIHEFSVADIDRIAHQAGLEIISKEPCLPFKYPRFLMLEMQKVNKK